MMQDAQSGQISYRTRPGAGPVLVCLHGIGSDATSFDSLIPHLPGGWRVIAWNAPGYGASEPLTRDWPVAADYADALAGFFDALELDRAMVLGHSLGTLMGTAFAAARPDRVSALALLAPAQGYGVAPGTELPATTRSRIDDLDQLGPAAFAAARAPRLLHRPADHPGALAQIEAAMARVSLPGYAQAVRMLASGDLSGDAARLACPTAVMVGAEDVVTPPDQAARVHAAVPLAARGPLHVLPGLGHALHQQDPGATARLLLPFLQECFDVER